MTNPIASSAATLKRKRRVKRTVDSHMTRTRAMVQKIQTALPSETVALPEGRLLAYVVLFAVQEFVGARNLIDRQRAQLFLRGAYCRHLCATVGLNYSYMCRVLEKMGAPVMEPCAA